MDIIRERIMSRVEVNANGCWIFQGAISSNGYGSAVVDGKSRSTHVLMHEATHGPVADGFEVDHRCHSEADCKGGPDCPHRACCNPAHLEAVPQIVNWERGQSPSRVNSLRTHCKHGHVLSGENVRVVTRKNRNPSRQCVPCHRSLNRAHMRTARAA